MSIAVILRTISAMCFVGAFVLEVYERCERRKHDNDNENKGGE